MVLEIIVMGSIGALLIVLGLIAWKKQKISLVHDYHHRHVKKQDVGAYTRLMGIGLIVIGIGIGLTEAVNLATKSGWGWIAFGVGFVAGFAFMSKAQRKYNGSWFS